LPKKSAVLNSGFLSEIFLEMESKTKVKMKAMIILDFILRLDLFSVSLPVLSVSNCR